MSSIRILVVEDFEPFRQFIHTTLQATEAQIIGEASDGLEAVRKADVLQPDLILLDIGLPTLNGIEVARQVRKLAPESKILFISQESSADVVQEALRAGALGYVVKTHAGIELLAAVETIRQGKQFISGGVPRKADFIRSHEVEFYSDDAAFVVGFTCFIEAALRAGKALIVVATESHRTSLLQRLQEQGVDMASAIEQGRYLPLDVADTLSTFMGSDLPDPARFFGVAGDLIGAAALATAGEQSRVAICGECASILWAQGKADAAIEVEQLCNQLTKRYEMDILCGFSLSSFYREEDKQVFQRICSEN